MSHLVANLGWVNLNLGNSLGWLALQWVAAVLPMQDGETFQIYVSKTKSPTRWDTLYVELVDSQSGRESG